MDDMSLSVYNNTKRYRTKIITKLLSHKIALVPSDEHGVIYIDKIYIFFNWFFVFYRYTNKL